MIHAASTTSAPAAGVSVFHSAIQRLCDRKEYAYFPEFRFGTGYSRCDNERRIDGLALPLYPHRARQGVMAFEIKVSRSDYAREMKNPLKLRPAYLQSNEFYFVTPLGLLGPGDIMLGAGLIEVTERGEPVMSCPAFHRDDVTPTWALVAALCRRAKGVEE